MALEAHARIGFAHAASVVHHLDKRFARIFYDKLNIGAAGINGVFQQLFDGRSGALDDFACCDLVGNGIGKKVDDVGQFFAADICDKGIYF
jgi:hypothetical protein